MMSAASEAFADAAQMAADNANDWRRSAGEPGADLAWVQHCVREEQRALDRAAWYLERKALLETPIQRVPLEEPIFYV
jgi:hypothetical protein